MNKAQVTKNLARHKGTIDDWFRLTGTGVHTNADKLARARQLAADGLEAIEANKLASAIQMLGTVQGILFAVGLHSWEFIVLDNERA